MKFAADERRARRSVDAHTMGLLFALAEARGVTERYAAMVSGKKVNVTEQRAALQMASRRFDAEPLLLEGVDLMPEIRAVRNCRGIVFKPDATAHRAAPTCVWSGAQWRLSAPSGRPTGLSRFAHG